MRRLLIVSPLLLLSVGCSGGQQDLSRVRIECSINENGSGSPSYALTILGNGKVHYQGFHNVGVPGSQDYVLPQTNVAAIVTALRDAHFFSMPERVPGVVFDCPVISIRYSDGRHQKLVIDNCRELLADAFRARGRGRWELGDSWADAAKNGKLGLWRLSQKLERLAVAQRFVHSGLADYALLIAEGWNANTSGKWGWTALDHAIGHRDYLSAGFLLENGAMGSDEALTIAAGVDDRKSLKMLLGARQISHTGLNRAVVLSARSHDISALQMLLAAGANPKGDPVWGMPIFEAVTNASGAAINVLVKHGADVNARDQRGDTPLIAAARGYDSGIVTQLIKLGAHLDAQDSRGKTALVNAYESCHYWTMIPLLDAGAALRESDLWRRTVSDQFPCGPADNEKMQRTTSLLKAAMARTEYKNRRK